LLVVNNDVSVDFTTTSGAHPHANIYDFRTNSYYSKLSIKGNVKIALVSAVYRWTLEELNVVLPSFDQHYQECMKAWKQQHKQSDKEELLTRAKQTE
jgi:hypothetical protein